MANIAKSIWLLWIFSILEINFEYQNRISAYLSPQGLGMKVTRVASSSSLTLALYESIASVLIIVHKRNITVPKDTSPVIARVQHYHAFILINSCGF